MKQKHLIWGMAALLLSASLAYAREQQSLLQADRALLQAFANSDANAVANLLDSEFTATDSSGRTQSRASVVSGVKNLSAIPRTNVQSHTYGQVGVVTSDDGKRHAMRIWVKRPQGWRALVYHEVSQADKAAFDGVVVTGSSDCTNPCKSVPYKPKNADEKGVITSWQQLETAVAGHDSAEWARHIADEFVVISSIGAHPIYKADRIATLDRQKQANTPSSPTPLVSAELHDFPGTIVMVSTHQRGGGKPAHVTRVWVKRGGVWQLAYSFQTSMQQPQQVAGR